MKAESNNWYSGIDDMDQQAEREAVALRKQGRCSGSRSLRLQRLQDANIDKYNRYIERKVFGNNL